MIYTVPMDNLSEYINSYEADELKYRDYSSLYLELIQKSMKGTDIVDLLNISNHPTYDYNEIYEGYSRIAFSRYLNSASYLYSRGKEPFAKDIWYVLMERLLEDLAGNHEMNGVEFTVLEICQALITFGNEDGRFTGYLDDINPYEKYHSTLERIPAEDLHNFCMYGICAEYLRSVITGTPADEFIERHWEVQKKKFNDRGMYMDPDCPHVYDITSRYRLALMLGYGYKGTAAGEMKDILMKGSETLLFSISSDCKFPFGGRSNQYQFNEALLASMCEFYSAEYIGIDPVRAGMFRRCAGGCIEGLGRWMDLKKPHHIKNMFPVDSGYGIDSYGTYNSYMTSAGSFITGALAFSQGPVKEYAPPCESGGYVYHTDMDFHSVFASAGGYSVQIDLSANQKYDATGLGRIHYKGTPCELALSVPFPARPKYLIPDNPGGRGIGPFWIEEKKKVYLFENGRGLWPVIIEQSKSGVEFRIQYQVRDRGNITEEYDLSADGLRVTYSSGFEDIGICIPLLMNNGHEESVVEEQDGRVLVKFNGYEYIICFDSRLKSDIANELLYNRNGVYRELNIFGKGKSLNIHYEISKSVQ